MSSTGRAGSRVLTVVLSNSASEDVGDRGLTGLRDGELSTLETYSGSGTYKTCKKIFIYRFRKTNINDQIMFYKEALFDIDLWQ